MTSSSVQLTALPNIPLVLPGDNLVELIQNGCADAGICMQAGDILVLAQKIVSKAERREVLLSTVKVSPKAVELSEILNKDPRLIELILSETKKIIRCTKGNKDTNEAGHLIVRHRLNHILANAGIDMSNIAHEGGDDRALLLPLDPDATCEQIAQLIYQQNQVHVGVIINDSLGRPWRNGVVGVALGVSGVPALLDLRGQPDIFGRSLKTSTIGFADEIASAASLIMGQSNEKQPIIHIRGLRYTPANATIQELMRPEHKDLFL
ncbi:MAG: coenzyme F420-0:L-glutamate ligase [Legionellaceae bacterium]|nr:coenzyme F420-0:L-glutamate ligase [Legionellaceae bacterium]